MKAKTIVHIAAVVLAAACGGSDSKPAATTTATVGPAGGTLSVGDSMLTIPAGAIGAATQVTLREAEPEHADRAKRVELEPRGLTLASPGRLCVRVDDTNARVMFHDASDSLVEVELEDRNHGRYKTSVTQLDAYEVQIEHLAACSPACTTGQECDDGVCKAHLEDAGAATCSTVCTSGEECDDGACKPHAGDPGARICDPACGTGLECGDGICKPHGG